MYSWSLWGKAQRVSLEQDLETKMVENVKDSCTGTFLIQEKDVKN